jgi:hypothetical protein
MKIVLWVLLVVFPQSEDPPYIYTAVLHRETCAEVKVRYDVELARREKRHYGLFCQQVVTYYPTMN